MALITSIRKHFWFVLILLGLALASFVLMDIVGSNNGGGGRGSMTLGEVAGNKINYKDFQTTENVYYRNAGNNTFSVRNSIWNYFVEKSIVENEASDLGLSVGTEELMDLQFGQNLSPVIEANWKNPQTKQVDRARLNDYKTAIEAGQELNPTFRNFWAEQEKQIIKAKLQNKLSTMVSKAIYTPKWMSEQETAAGKEQLKLAYVKIPSTKITETVELTDADYTSFLDENKAKYKIDEDNRVLDLAVFPVKATKADSSKLFDELMESKLAFQKAANDSLYAVTNNGSYANFYFEADKLPPVIKAAVLTMDNGDAYGPYIENNAYNAVKLIDKKMIPDSVKASHILRSVDLSVPGQLASAQKYIDSLKQMILGGASFSELAKANSQDPGSGAKGGDLGYFGQGRMVPAFNDVCFYGNKKNMHVVQTQFGIHLIKVHDQKYVGKDPKYKLAFIRTPIIPSQYTQDMMYDEISSLLTAHEDYASLKAGVEGLKGEFVTSAPVKLNDFNVNNLGAGQVSRDIVKWAFKPGIEAGDIAPEVFTYTDNTLYYNNKYVLAVVNQVNSAGMPSVASMKSTLKSQVENYKKSQNLVAQVGTDLNQIAAKYGVKVDTAKNVSFTTSYVPGIGNEPEVIAKAFKASLNGEPVAIAGTSGVFVVKVIGKSESADVSGLPQFKNNARDNKRRTVSAGLIQALKKELDIEDNRNTFF